MTGPVGLLDRVEQIGGRLFILVTEWERIGSCSCGYSPQLTHRRAPQRTQNGSRPSDGVPHLGQNMRHWPRASGATGV